MPCRPAAPKRRNPCRHRLIRTPVRRRAATIPNPPATGGSEIRLTGLTWRPARRREPVLADLDLHIPAGQRVLLGGPSGAGKSTLLRAIAGLLTPAAGDVSGRATLDGIDPADRPGCISFVLQNPSASIVADTVGRDVAFGLENLRRPREQIWPQVDRALAAARFPYPPDHPTSKLSGGEAQRLSLAGALAMDSRVLLLDEPTSMLDPESAASVRGAVKTHIGLTGSTAVIVDHQLGPWVDFVDRVVVLGIGGGIVADGEPGAVIDSFGPALIASGVWVPGSAAPALLSVPRELVEPAFPVSGELITATDVSVERRSSLTDRRAPKTRALRGVSATMTAGATLALTGPSGAGKTTLLTVLAALERPSSGTVRASPAMAINGRVDPARWRSRELVRRISWAPQQPEIGFVATTALDEVMASGRSCQLAEEPLRRRSAALLEVFGLSDLADTSPFHLSGGEQRRLSIAATLAHGAPALLFDEPTVGQDRSTWAAVLGALSAASDAGAGVVFASHDDRAVAAIGGRTVRIDAGLVV